MMWQLLGVIETLPEIFTELGISYFLFRQLRGEHTEGDKKAAKSAKAIKEWSAYGEITDPCRPGGRVSALKADLGKTVLTNSVCMEIEEKKITLSQRVGINCLHLIAWG